MISASVVAVDGGHGHGGLGGLPPPHPAYMGGYADTSPTWPPTAPNTNTHQHKHQEFLRPAPKPLHTTRYNGSLPLSSLPNGARLLTGSPRTGSKYPSPPSASPVNLSYPPQSLTTSKTTSIKEEPMVAPTSEDLSIPSSYPPGITYARMYQSAAAQSPGGPFATGVHYPSSLTGGPYGPLYPGPYTPLIRTNYVQPPPLSPLEAYASTPSSAGLTSYSPPGSGLGGQLHSKTCQNIVRPEKLDKKQHLGVSNANFKVPSGKEGSLKHRILTRPPGESRRRLGGSALSPPVTPTKVCASSGVSTNNNTTVPGNFMKGSLIQLANGELRKVEDMRTEDFVLSAEKSPELRLAESTVVRIEENPITGTSTITLSYNQNRTQVEFESTLDHPFFVYGQGWASCNPDRTLQCYGLKVHRLQVGDILVSLTPREPSTTLKMPSTCSSSKSSTITTTATTTAMTARQQSNSNTISSKMLSTSEHQVRNTGNLSIDRVLLSSDNTTALTTRQPNNSNIISMKMVSTSEHQIRNSGNLPMDRMFLSAGSNTALTARHKTVANVSSSTMMTTNEVDRLLLPPPGPVSDRGDLEMPIDATMGGVNSRKRRWSAPEQICDDDEAVARKIKE